MTKLFPIAAIAVGLLLFSGCKDHTDEIEDLETRIAATESKLKQQQESHDEESSKFNAEIDRLKAESQSPSGLDDRLDSLSKRIDESESSDSADRLAGKVTALEKRLSDKIDAVKAEAIDAAKVEAAKIATGDIDKEAMAEAIARKMAEEAAANAPTKELSTALDRLDISQAEKDQIKQRIIDAKQETLELLEVPTADGRIFAEELIDAFIQIQDGKGTEADIGALFVELQATKIPGDIEGRTYAEALEGIKKQNKEDIGRLLSEDDQKKLDRAHEDWSEFEVGDEDPFGALYMERMQKYQADKEENKND